MGLFNRYKFGTRILRMGMRGPDVLTLQTHLRERGYDIPQEEQHFGYLTREALEQFQRDYGLAVDGVAGKAVFALLMQEKLPITRCIHHVAPGETIEKIAAQYGVGVEAFAASNRIHRLYPGQRLVFFDREVWAIGVEPARGQELTGLLVPVDLNDPEAHIPKLKAENAVLALYTTAEDEILWIHHQICTPLRRKRLAERVQELARGSRGVCFCFENLSRVDGARYLALLKRMRRVLGPDQRLMVQIGPKIPRRGLTSGLDFQGVSRVVDRVVVQLPPPVSPGPILDRGRVEKILWPLMREINAWQILLRIPVYALLWKLAEPQKPAEKLSSQEAVARLYRHSARIGRDSEPFYEYTSRGVEYHLRLVQRAAFGQVVALVNLHNLAGVVLDRLGMEDGKLWSVLRSHFRTTHF